MPLCLVLPVCGSLWLIVVHCDLLRLNMAHVGHRGSLWLVVAFFCLL